MNETFWIYNPIVLFHIKRIEQLWPQINDSMENKLNAITRLVMLLTITGYIFFKSNLFRLLLTSSITLFVIVIYYRYYRKENEIQQESFINVANEQVFTQPTNKNPMMNVMPFEIGDNPKRNPAAPSFHNTTKQTIKENVKSNLDQKLFKDLSDEIDFENSQRAFYTMPNTQIPNDQKGFAEFCFGNTAYQKENNM